MRIYLKNNHALGFLKRVTPARTTTKITTTRVTIRDQFLVQILSLTLEKCIHNSSTASSKRWSLKLDDFCYSNFMISFPAKDIKVRQDLSFVIQLRISENDVDAISWHCRLRMLTCYDNSFRNRANWSNRLLKHINALNILVYRHVFLIAGWLMIRSSIEYSLELSVGEVGSLRRRWRLVWTWLRSRARTSRFSAADSWYLASPDMDCSRDGLWSLWLQQSSSLVDWPFTPFHVNSSISSSIVVIIGATAIIAQYR